MKDRVKIALKRGTSGLLAVLLAVCLVGQPKAKAVVSETALLGSIFGSLLVSMGYSWAAENMDMPSFGEAIYKDMKEFDDALKNDSGLSFLADLNLTLLTPLGAGKIGFPAQWVRAANSFAEWFAGKYLSGSQTSATVVSSSGSIKLGDNTYDLGTYTVADGKMYNVAGIYDYFDISYGSYSISASANIKDLLENSHGETYSFNGFSVTFNGNYKITSNYGEFQIAHGSNDLFAFTDFNGVLTIMQYYERNNQVRFLNSACFGSVPISDVAISGFSLTAEKPQEVHYPDIAEDGSQVYEITVDGVTATDIEGIIQGAVDRILAGTAAIAGSIADAQAKPGEITSPEIDPYKVGLSSVFPFCIPFDVYNMVTMFVADPEAPHAEWTFSLPWGSQEYSVGWDLAAFDGVARVCRDMELVLFAVGLAVITYKVIKW